MKKGMGLKLGAIILALSLFGCSSDLLEETKKESFDSDTTYGCLIVNDSRALNINDKIKNAKVTVSSSDMTDISVDSEVSGGKGTFFIDKIPVGDNRVVTIQALDENGKNISGWTMRNVIDIKAGSNSVVVDWNSTGLGNVYSELLAKGEKIANYTDAQDSSIKGAVPSALGYYVDSAAIANDFKNSSLKSSESYKMTAAKLTYKSAGATGYTITVLDPTSANKTIASESEGSVENIAPGKWKVIVNDGTKDVVNKTMTFTNAETTDLGTLGDPLKDKVIVFVESDSQPYIWAWEKKGTGNGVAYSEELSGSWGQPSSATTMVAATSDYMNDPAGWYMIDYTDVSAGGEICFKLNWSDPERVSGKTKSFWFDGVNFYDTDPTAAKLSSDATLSAISVNGENLADFDSETTSYTYTIFSTTESAYVRAVANDENATVQVTPDGNASIDKESTRAFTIVVTAEDGSTTKNYTVNVKRAVENDTSLTGVTVNGRAAIANSNGSFTYSTKGSDDSFVIESIIATPTDSSASVKYSATSGTVASEESKTITITVTNGTKSASYELIVSYTKVEITGGEYYWTNKDGAVGTNKTISSWSDWTAAERIAQNAAYDDPRTWMGIQEVPYDVYALYAAWDNDNLYVMVELVNAADRAKDLFMWHDYAASDNAWWDNRDIPLGMLFNTGARKSSLSPLVGAKNEPIWGGVDFTDSEGFDAMFYHSSKYGYAEHKKAFVGVGTPGFFTTTSTGVFDYGTDYCKKFAGETADGSGVHVRYMRTCAVSDKIYIESTPTDNRGTSGQDGNALLESTNYTSVATSDRDMSYWYTIPLSCLGITKSDIETNGIGIRQLTTNGGSLMDCSPWDVSMVDVATEPCSDDASTSHEKEDVDNITSPQARIGKM